MALRLVRYVRSAVAAIVLPAVASAVCGVRAFAALQDVLTAPGPRMNISAVQVRNLPEIQATEASMTPIELSMLDSLAARRNDPDRLSELVDVLLRYVGADAWDDSFRARVFSVLITSEQDPQAFLAPHEFLASLNGVLDTLHIRPVFDLSDSGLFQTRTALTRTMPHFFSNPSTTVGLRPIERLYLLHLIWENGTLTKEEKYPPVKGTITTVIFANGRRSQYIGLRDKHLRQTPEADLRKAFNQLCLLLASPAEVQ